MSAIVYKLIPQDPFFELPEELVVPFKQKMKTINDDNRLEITERVQFIDAGEEFHGICCPFCDAALDPLWWHQKMAAFYARTQGFYDLTVTTPCCEKSTSLNELVYDWPQGFASVSVQTTHEASLPILKEAALELTGVPWRWVKARYEVFD